MTREEAIKQIRLVLENLKANLEKDTREAFETIIPEIKESEYERIRKKILDIVRTAPFDEEKDILEDWLEKQEEQKTVEWSEDIIQKAVKEVGLTQHQIDWFKTNVFPPKQEWSEEDEENISKLHRLLVICQGEKKFIPTSEYEKLDSWLKSLRPSWKPSEEQMEAFKQSIEWDDERADDFDKTLQSLYNDLKKLL